jgi:hypothetical protein
MEGCSLQLPEHMNLDREPAIVVLKKMLDQVADIKKLHGRTALRPRTVGHA